MSQPMAKRVVLISSAVMVSCVLLLALAGTEQLLTGAAYVVVGGFIVSIALALRDTFLWFAARPSHRR